MNLSRILRLFILICVDQLRTSKSITVLCKSAEKDGFIQLV